MDVEGFGDSHRSDAHQVAVREGLYRALEMAFSASGIPWAECYREDRGDGVLVLVPPHVPKALFAMSLPEHLAEALREHNAVHSVKAQIRLRMALHAGEMYLDRHGATGRSVNLVFRLLEASELRLALARASGVLALIVSSWFFEEVVQNTPASIATAYRKAEVAVKETGAIAWILVPDLQHAPTVPRQLPAAPQIVGRATELGQLSALLDARLYTRLCVISGIAGVGKTALALRWAHLVADRFPDGELFIDLNGFSAQVPVEAAEALHGFLTSMGVDLQAIPTTLGAKAALYRSLLAQRQMLVVLDNARDYEHVLPLLPGAFPGTMIITSRNKLAGLTVRADIRQIELDVLGTHHALQVLARQAKQPRRIDAESQAAVTVTQLCAGLPLALKIAAARAAIRPRLRLQQLAAELSDERNRLTALMVGDAGLGLRQVFSWSHKHLPDQSARLFRLLGVHPGPDIDVYAAAALTGTSLMETRRSIDNLLETHLLEERLPDRFVMHDLISAYVRDLAIDNNDYPSALNRLFDYYLSTADQADRFISPHRYRIPLNIGNTTITTPVIGSYHQALGLLSTEHRNLMEMCRIAGTGFEDRSWQLAYTLRSFFFLTKRWDAWIQTHELALAACLRSGDRKAEAMTRNNLGRALLESGRQDEAASHYESALRLFEEIGDWHGVSNALANQATILRRQGKLDDALRHNIRALAYYRQAGARRNAAITLRSISLVELGLRRLADARNHAEEALKGFVELGIHLEAAKGFNTLGLILQHCGDLAVAPDAYRQAIEFSRQCSSIYEEARALHRLGAISVMLGANNEAKRQWRQALHLYQSLGAAKAGQVAADLAELANRNPP
ncbi:MAG: tetratricopeptide repeat protein [Streptosporangiaceae bacterium]|nr:tetratricopeptide repeat protein [Streptosporangiaceae bacterium]